MKYYIAMCLPSTSGGWRAFFPDIPDCEVAAPSLDRAVFRAANALADHTVRLNGSAVDILPLPRDLTAIKADKEWSAANARQLVLCCHHVDPPAHRPSSGGRL